MCSALNTLDNPSSLDLGRGRLSFRVASSLLPALASSYAADLKQTLVCSNSVSENHDRVCTPACIFIICMEMSATHTLGQLIIILTAPAMGRVDSPHWQLALLCLGPCGGTPSLPPGEWGVGPA